MGRTSLQWTPEMIAQLGTDKDAVLAERWGTTAKTVNLKRNSLGIAAFGHVLWTPEMLAQLGTQPDADLATAWQISKASVVAKRGTLGIAPSDERRALVVQHRWTPDEIAQLGTAPDAQIARKLGLSAAAVRNARMARGMAASGRSPAPSATAAKTQAKKEAP